MLTSRKKKIRKLTSLNYGRNSSKERKYADDKRYTQKERRKNDKL